MSIEVPLDRLAAEIDRWDFCYLLTVSDDARPHLLALRPETSSDGGVPVLRFDAGGGRARSNTAERPDVTLVFPPVDHSDGMSLVVDGRGSVDDDGRVAVRATWAVLHRAAP